MNEQATVHHVRWLYFQENNMAINLAIVATPTGKTAIRIDIKNERGDNFELVDFDEMDDFGREISAMVTMCNACTILQAYLMQSLEMSVENAARESRTMLGIGAEIHQRKKGRRG